MIPLNESLKKEEQTYTRTVYSGSGKIDQIFKFALRSDEIYQDYTHTQNPKGKYNISVEQFFGAGANTQAHSQTTAGLDQKLGGKAQVHAGDLKGGLSAGGYANRHSTNQSDNQIQSDGDYVQLQVRGGEEGWCCGRASQLELSLVLKSRKVPSDPASFGPAEWENYFGPIGSNPPKLPTNIEAILNRPCPVDPTKKIKETHLLILIPSTINHQPLTLRSWSDWITKPKKGNPTKYFDSRSFYNKLRATQGEEWFKNMNDWRDRFEKQLFDEANTQAHWVLMGKGIIPGSRQLSYSEQLELIAQLSKKSGQTYAVPKLLDAAVAFTMHYICTGEYLLERKSGKAETYTRCQEKLIEASHQTLLGSYSKEGLDFHPRKSDTQEIGIGYCIYLKAT